MATHSSVLAWRIPGTGEPGGLLSMGLNRVGHDWSDLAAAGKNGRAQLNWENTGPVIAMLKGQLSPQGLVLNCTPSDWGPKQLPQDTTYKLTIKIHKNHIPWIPKMTGRFLKLGFWLRTSWGCFLQMQIPRHFPGLLNSHLFLWGPSVSSFSKISRGSYLFNIMNLAAHEKKALLHWWVTLIIKTHFAWFRNIKMWVKCDLGIKAK